MNKMEIEIKKSTAGGDVTNLFGPVYDKFQGLPRVFADKKVEKAFQEFGTNVSRHAKQAVSQTQSAMHKAQQETKKFFDSAIQTVQNPGEALRNLTVAAIKEFVIGAMKDMLHKLGEIFCHPIQKIVKMFKHVEEGNKED